ncbi:nucleoside deaminase [Echinicola jeungdonensis]|uniref:Nucleoside deaminase n=2 Tax=Echinicola jeungdonensis TaxID=709343 RepID=A0ABV5J2J3_9BACT|nr:nucleoside deaminase [Echinicola jeungdonensis]MDN3667772.1 nucleoside deaminase [Echinicola jeungdonensis]
MTEQQRTFMEMAISLAKEGMSSGKGGPFGCIVVKEGVVIGKGNNSVLSTNDPTAHAEIMAIRDACKSLGHFQLEDCEVYSSCEPCPMCLGAIYWARPKRVFFANTRKDAANAGFDDDFIYQELPIAPENRKIPMIHFKQNGAKEVFQMWIDKPDKKIY